MSILLKFRFRAGSSRCQRAAKRPTRTTRYVIEAWLLARHVLRVFLSLLQNEYEEPSKGLKGSRQRTEGISRAVEERWQGESESASHPATTDWPDSTKVICNPAANIRDTKFGFIVGAALGGQLFSRVTS